MSARPSMARLAALMAARDASGEDPTDPTKAPSVGSVGSGPGAFAQSPCAPPELCAGDATEAVGSRSGLLAFLDDATRPIGVSADRWGELMAAAHAAVLSCGDALLASGWSLPDLFAVPEVWLRLDRRGPGWHLAEALAAGGRLVAATPEAIRFANARGAVFTIRRRVATPAG